MATINLTQEFTKKYKHCPICDANLISSEAYVVCFDKQDSNGVNYGHFTIDSMDPEYGLTVRIWFDGGALFFEKISLIYEWKISLINNKEKGEIVKNISDQEFHLYMTDKAFLNRKIDNFKLLI